MTRLRTTMSACVTGAVFVLAGCGSSVTGQSPQSVENEAGGMVSDSLGVFSPAVSRTVVSSGWSPCSQETPGVHRFEYKRVVDFGVAQAGAQKAIGQITAEWGKKGYTVQPQSPGDPRVSALGQGDWRLLIGVEAGGAQMFITVDSGCVDVSSDPKTG